MVPSFPVPGAGWPHSEGRDTALGSGGGTVGTGLVGFCCSWGCPCLSAQRPISPGVTAKGPMQVMVLFCHGLSCRLKMVLAAGPQGRTHGLSLPACGLVCVLLHAPVLSAVLALCSLCAAYVTPQQWASFWNTCSARISISITSWDRHENFTCIPTAAPSLTHLTLPFSAVTPIDWSYPLT